MKIKGLIPLAFLMLPPSCLFVAWQEIHSSPNPEKILEEFFSFKPPKEKLIAVLRDGAKEPFKTKIVEKIWAESSSPSGSTLSNEEASDILAADPPELYARQLWEIVERKGALKDWCKILSLGPEEYQPKALALIFGRNLIIEEYVFYLMQLEYQTIYARQIWDGFMKLNPAKNGFFLAAKSAGGYFQDLAILQLLSWSEELKLTVRELEEILGLISEVEKKRAEKRQEKLIETMRK